jgi:magnesium transporter
VLDRTVDQYEPVARAVDEDIYEVEGQVFSADREFPTERIYGLQREVLELHRALAPLVEPTRRLAAGELDFVTEELAHYFADVHDHVVRTNDQVDSFRDLLHGILEANLAQVGVQQNNDMRRITAWVGILAVPTSIAGIYGMNFEHMPELRWEYGYPAVLGVIAIVCTSLYIYFKRAGWL